MIETGSGSGAAGLFEVAGFFDGFGIVFLGGELEKDAGLGAIRGNAVSPEVEIGKSDGGFGVAGLHGFPELIRIQGVCFGARRFA